MPRSELLTEPEPDGPWRGGRDVSAVDRRALEPADQRVALRPAIGLAVFAEGVVDEQLDVVAAVAEPRTEVCDGVRRHLAKDLALGRTQVRPSLADVGACTLHEGIQRTDVE